MKAGIQELLHDEVEEQFEQLKQKKESGAVNFAEFAIWQYW